MKKILPLLAALYITATQQAQAMPAGCYVTYDNPYSCYTGIPTVYDWYGNYTDNLYYYGTTVGGLLNNYVDLLDDWSDADANYTYALNLYNHCAGDYNALQNQCGGNINQYNALRHRRRKDRLFKILQSPQKSLRLQMQKNQTSSVFMIVNSISPVTP